MPKYKKNSKKTLKSNKISDEAFKLKSVRISAILGGFFLVLSLLFNGTEIFFNGIISIYLGKTIYWETLDNALKVSVILIAFFFMLISVGNFKELTGKPVNLKEILLLLGLSLIQTIRNVWVFIFTLIGLFIILIYLYLIQDY